MNDAVVYEFGLDRAQQVGASEAALQAALTAVPYLWNRIAGLHRAEDRHFLTERVLDTMAGSISANARVSPIA